MMKSTQKKPFKVISYKPYRINFIYDGKHFSLNLFACWGGYCVGLICKEVRRSEFQLIKEFHEIPWIYMKPGQTFKHTDFSKIFDVIERYVKEF